MPTSLAFTVALTTVEGGWIQAQLRELPNVVTCAPTEQEAREAAMDALREYLASFSTPVKDSTTSGRQAVVRVTIDAA